MPTFSTTDHNGFLLESVEAMRRTLSQSAQVQAWLGVGDDAAAFDAIKTLADDAPADLERYTETELAFQRPRVFVDLLLDRPCVATRKASNQYATTGSIEVAMEREMTEQELGDANLFSANLAKAYGRMIEELRASATDNDTLDWSSIELTSFGRLAPTEENTIGQLAVMVFAVTWGQR